MAWISRDDDGIWVRPEKDSPASESVFVGTDVGGGFCTTPTEQHSVGWPTINPTLAFIETDELAWFIADGGSREVRYCDNGFEFGYKLGDCWVSWILPDSEQDPRWRERMILVKEYECLATLRKMTGEN